MSGLEETIRSLPKVTSFPESDEGVLLNQRFLLSGIA